MSEQKPDYDVNVGGVAYQREDTGFAPDKTGKLVHVTKAVELQIEELERQVKGILERLEAIDEQLENLRAA